MRRITQSKLYKAIGPYSYGTFFDFLFFSSGITGIDPKTNKTVTTTLREEAVQLMKNIRTLLKEVNLIFDDIVNVNLYLTDMSFYDEFNSVYKTYFVNGRYPARTCVEVKALPGGASVEIEFIAVKRK